MSNRFDWIDHLDAEDFTWHAKVCQSKVKYRDKNSAKHAAITVKNIHGKKLRPYACNICDGFHLLSVAKRNRKQEQKRKM